MIGHTNRYQNRNNALHIYIDYRYINIYLYNIHTLFTYSSFLTIVSVEVKNSIY